MITECDIVLVRAYVQKYLFKVAMSIKNGYFLNLIFLIMLTSPSGKSIIICNTIYGSRNLFNDGLMNRLVTKSSWYSVTSKDGHVVYSRQSLSCPFFVCFVRVSDSSNVVSSKVLNRLIYNLDFIVWSFGKNLKPFLLTKYLISCSHTVI